MFRLMLTTILTIGTAATIAVAAAGDDFTLVSAQVVTYDSRPAALKLTATGPIAFHVLTAAESETPLAPNRLTARLYGVTAGDLRAATNLSPFVMSIQSIDHDSLLTITTGSLPANATLVLRPGLRANELVAEVITTP
jgi:hypothetical protein